MLSLERYVHVFQSLVFKVFPLDFFRKLVLIGREICVAVLLVINECEIEPARKGERTLIYLLAADHEYFVCAFSITCA